MPSRAAAEMAEAGFRPYEALAPTSFGRVVSPHKGEVSRRSWVPKNWNDRERDGEVNADQEVWDVADVDEAVMFRKMGAVRTASVTEAEAEGAFKSTYMVHREKQLKSTGTGADYKVSTKYKTRFCARGDRDKFQIDYWAKSANTLRVEDMQLFFAGDVRRRRPTDEPGLLVGAPTGAYRPGCQEDVRGHPPVRSRLWKGGRGREADGMARDRRILRKGPYAAYVGAVVGAILAQPRGGAVVALQVYMDMDVGDRVRGADDGDDSRR